MIFNKEGTYKFRLLPCIKNAKPYESHYPYVKKDDFIVYILIDGRVELLNVGEISFIIRSLYNGNCGVDKKTGLIYGNNVANLSNKNIYIKHIDLWDMSVGYHFILESYLNNTNIYIFDDQPLEISQIIEIFKDAPNLEDYYNIVRNNKISQII